MEQFRKFLRDKAFALVLTACLLAAAAAGVWAVRTVRNELKQDLDAVRSPSSTAPGIDEGINTSPGVAGEEEAEWQQQNAPAANSVANVPKADSSSGGAASSSGARSGSGSVREPSALQTESLPASSSAAPASTQPVSGRVLNSYSGDELVYSKTLGDWRTHNGVDYAAEQGRGSDRPGGRQGGGDRHGRQVGACGRHRRRFRQDLAGLRHDGRQGEEGRHRLGRADHRQGGQRELRVRRGEPHPLWRSWRANSISTPSRP